MNQNLPSHKSFPLKPGKTSLAMAWPMSLLAVLLFSFFPNLGQAQITLTCPANIVVSADSAACSALVTYSDPTTNATGIQSDTFFFTGSAQTWTIPANVMSLNVRLWGAEGSKAADRLPTNSAGGLGGYAAGDLAVMPGQVLTINVGGQGDSLGNGGFNGGGNGGSGSAGGSCFGGPAGGGGGASDLRLGGTTLGNRVAVAAGGGGAGRDYCNGSCQPCGCGGGGGGAGGLTGGSGAAGYNCGFGYAGQAVNLGGGATASTGGAGGPSDGGSGNPGLAGAIGIGGTGANGNYDVAGGGGGGGYYGGGGGGGANSGSGVAGGGGGGGSSFLDSLTNSSTVSGLRSGDGMIIITYGTSAPIVQTSGLSSTSSFPGGITTNAFIVIQGMDSATCSFTVTVEDNEAPTIVCPTAQTLQTDANCTANIPDYSAMAMGADNCDANPAISQSPMAGSALTGAPTTQMVLMTVTDSTGNIDTCSFSVSLMDTVAPVVQNCPANIDFTPTTLDCNPAITFTAPTASDACGASMSSTHVSGDNFPMGTTTVTFMATDSSGNMDSCSFDVTVNNPQLNNMITASPSTTACEGDTINLSAPPGFTYLWSINPTTQSIIVITGGTYWVDITDNNCTGRDSIDVTINATPAPVVAMNNGDLCTGTFSTYQWFLNGNAISGANSACYTPAMDGNYTVSVTENGCEGVSDVFLFVAIGEEFQNELFSIFPNPAEDELHIRMTQALNSAGEIKLYDLTGRVVLTKAFRSLKGTETVYLGELPGGTYVVEIASGSLLTRRSVVHLD